MLVHLTVDSDPSLRAANLKMAMIDDCNKHLAPLQKARLALEMAVASNADEDTTAPLLEMLNEACLNYKNDSAAARKALCISSYFLISEI